jgi:hypothetical protein
LVVYVITAILFADILALIWYFVEKILGHI